MRLQAATGPVVVCTGSPWVWYCVDYIRLLCLGRVEWFTRVVRCTIYATLFLLRFHFVHYTGIYTGKVAVVAMLFPTRVDTSCGGLYLLYLTYCLSISY